jgi:hypothetical protein
MTKNEHQDQQNRQTFKNNNFTQDKQEININQNIQRSNEKNDFREKQRQIYEKMNQHLLNKKRNVDWNQNPNYNNDNKNIFINRNEIDKNKVFYDREGGFPLDDGRNGLILQTLNEQNKQNKQNHYQNQSQNINMQNSIQILPPNNATSSNINQRNININNNGNNSFKTNIQNRDDQINRYMCHQIKINSNSINHMKNDFQKNILENSSNNYNYSNSNNNYRNEDMINSNEIKGENSNSEKKSSGIASSLLYGLIFGSFGTILLWCKNPRVREYLMNCYQNINVESILNFLKLFLHPIDLIKSLGSNMDSFKEILKESLNYIYRFIEDYSDIWRLLGIIVMIYALWLFIKLIINKMFKKKGKNKNLNQRGNNIQSNH